MDIKNTSTYLKITELDKNTFIVQNILSKIYLKINYDTLFLINTINSTSSLPEVLKIINSEKEKVTIEELSNLVTVFKKNGLLKSEHFESSLTNTDYLKLSTSLFNLEVVNSISSRLRFLFQPKVFIFLIILSCSIIAFTVIGNFNLIYRQFSLSNLLNVGFLFVSLYIIINFVHEFGHTSALNYFNEKSGHMGIGFYLLIPVLFVDVSNAWNLSRKNRIIVNSGGLYFELIFTSILFMVYFFTNKFELLVLGIIILMQMVSQLNPFVRTDGYWILSDYLELPNLKQKSILEVKKLFNLPKSKINKSLFLYGLMSFLLTYIVILFVFLNNSSVIYLFTNFSTVYSDYQYKSLNFFNILVFLGSVFFYLLLLKQGLTMSKQMLQYKRFVFTLLLVSISFLSYSQHTVNGIISDKTGIPVSYAYISTKANKIGVVSNEAGQFQINTSRELDDSLFVTHIGFSGAFQLIDQKKKFYEIKLEHNDIMLEEVSITAFKQDDLIKRIKKNIPLNYPQTTSVQQSYFNYEVKNDDLLLGYFDGSLNLDIKSYGDLKSHFNSRLLNVNLNINNFKKIPNFYYTSSVQILSYIFPLNLPFISKDAEYKYNVEEFETDNLPYYKVYFEPKNEEKKRMYSGEFFVSARNYAITEARFHLVKNLQNKDASINLGFSTSKTITSTNTENIVIKYQLNNGIYFNAFIKYTTDVTFYDSKINSTRNITINAVNMTTSFKINPTKEEIETGQSFNLFTLKTQKREQKSDKNTYLGIDWEDKIKNIKRENPELGN